MEEGSDARLKSRTLTEILNILRVEILLICQQCDTALRENWNIQQTNIQQVYIATCVELTDKCIQFREQTLTQRLNIGINTVTDQWILYQVTQMRYWATPLAVINDPPPLVTITPGLQGSQYSNKDIKVRDSTISLRMLCLCTPTTIPSKDSLICIQAF